jgi:GDP-L-fucose synthase
MQLVLKSVKNMIDLNSRILVAGANGMVGSAIVRNLESKGCVSIIKGTRQEVDFTNQDEVYRYFSSLEPEYVFLAAAKVGGILGNKNHKAEMIYDNLMIQSNIIDASYQFGVKKLLFLGSSCIYPKFCEVPISESSLLSGYLEPTNDAYAIAKIAGIKMCQSYREQYGFNAISVMPCNLYGPGDNFDLETSHVLPALIRKLHEGGKVVLWGDGTPKREFLHADDLAEACYVCMQKYDEFEHINIGSGEDISIKELASIISDIVGYGGDIEWDTEKPNGTLRKVLNVEKIKSLGWKPEISLHEGIKKTYNWYKKTCLNML